MSLLTIVTQAMQEIGLGQPTSVIGNADVRAQQAGALVNRAGLELRDMTAAADYWPVIRKQFLFNMLLHCADISNPAKTVDIFDKW